MKPTASASSSRSDLRWPRRKLLVELDMIDARQTLLVGYARYCYSRVGDAINLRCFWNGDVKQCRKTSRVDTDECGINQQWTCRMGMRGQLGGWYVCYYYYCQPRGDQVVVGGGGWFAPVCRRLTVCPGEARGFVLGGELERSSVRGGQVGEGRLLV